MRIVIDMQGAQTASRTRGIGRWSMAFAQAVVRNRGPHDVCLALNGLFPETIMPIREAFDGLLPRDRIRVWYAPGPLAAKDGNEDRRRRAALIREAFLASLDPDIVHVTSPFEGLVDDAVTSVGTPGSAFATSVTLYDLIPLHDPDRFLGPNPAGEAHYRQTLADVERADLLLAISAFTARDAAARLDVGDGRIVAVSSAHDDIFRPRKEDAAARHDLLHRLGIPSRFILTAGTIEPHKNLERLFAAFARLPRRLHDERALVLIGKFPGGQRDVLREMATRAGLRRGQLVVTGYVSDEDLVRLYNACDLMVLPSLDEGFGLPALEAMACGAPTIGSRAASIPEIIGRDDALFDPTDVADMARLMEQGLEDAAFRGSLTRHAPARAAGFSWDTTARKSLAAMEQAVALARRAREDASPGRGFRASWEQRPGLALIAAAQPGDMLADSTFTMVVVRLSRLHRVTVVSTRYLPPPAGSNWDIRDSDWLLANACSIDRLVYRFGPGVVPTHLLELFLRLPGVIWLEEPFLGPTLAQLEEDTGRSVWTNALYDSHGYAAVRDRFRDPARARTSHPASPALLSTARGVVAGSDAVAALARSWFGKALPRTWHTGTAPDGAGMAAADMGNRLSDAIESAYDGRSTGVRDLVDALVASGAPLSAQDAPGLAHALARGFPAARAQRQLLLDVSHTSENDLRTGIQRVVRAVILALLEAPPVGFRVEPVFLSNATGRWHYRYARRFTLGLLGCPAILEDDVVEVAAGDALIVLDLSGRHFVDAEAGGLHADLRRHGVAAYGTIYDLLPVQIPHRFPQGTRPGFEQWLSSISRLDGAVCISSAVAEDYRRWLEASGEPVNRRFRIGWFHLGADIDRSDPTRGLPPDAPARLSAFAARPTFLMVGTIEPRKGHLQAIDAFDLLWDAGVDVNLVIVGAEGWRGLPDAMRNDIPGIVAKLSEHPQRDGRLVWLKGISDEYLEKVYAASACLLAASEGEGFGLPLIEAARHRIPILARDLPVFREVAGDHAAYFSGLAPADLAAAVRDWLALRRDGRQPRSDGMPWKTWEQSAARIAALISQWEDEGQWEDGSRPA